MSICTHASYALFYTLIDTPRVLICKTYRGLKIDKKEVRIFCRTGENKTYPMKSTELIFKEIDDAKKILIESGTMYVNLRIHKFSDSSIHFISDNKNLFSNFIGGGRDNLETPIETLRRELDEELFVNSCEDKKFMLDDILSNITDKIVSDNKFAIFLINYDILCESVKDFLKNGIINPKFFHRVGKSCGIDVELGEICSLHWLNFKEISEKIKNGNDTTGEKSDSLSKFNKNNILLDELKKLFCVEKNTEGGSYYAKYIKYKNKYLMLKNKYLTK